MAKTSGISPEKILEVAEAIIAIKGVKETTLKDIAKAVGISKGTLYYHYATKEALLYDIIGRHFERVTQRLLRMAGRGQTPEDVLTLMLEDLGEQRQINRLHLTLVGEMLAGDDAMRQKYIERYQRWEESVKRVLDKLFGTGNPTTDRAVGLLLTFVEGHAVRSTLIEAQGAYRDMAAVVAGLYEKWEVLSKSEEDNS